MEDVMYSGEVINAKKKSPPWSIDDDTLFHPLGLKNLGSEAKTVIVTWNEDYILNFVIKKSTNTTIKKVRIHLPTSEIVKTLLVLELNTLLLMESGLVYFFTSAKRVHKITWLNGVRSISAAVPVGFSVLRLINTDDCKQMVLEVYSDIADLNMGKRMNMEDEFGMPLVEKFKIPNEELNVFHNLWQDEEFNLLSICVNEENLIFLQKLVGCEEEEIFVEQILHFFSISTSVYVLLPNPQHEAGFSTCLLNRYASDVKTIIINPNLHLGCFLLKCGTLDIWYLTPGTCIIKRLTYNLEAKFECFDFALNGNEQCLYYATEDDIVELKLVYDSNLDRLNISEQRRTVPGILACTWVPTIQQLVCLSDNNIFYQISFQRQHMLVAKQSTELKSMDIEHIKHKSDAINELTRIRNNLQSVLEAENLNRRMLGTINNCFGKQNFTLTVEYCQSIKVLWKVISIEQTLLPNNFKLDATKYVVLKFNPHNDSILMHVNAACSLYIILNYSVYIFDIKHFLDKSESDKCLILPIYGQNIQDVLFPSYSFRLISFIPDTVNVLCMDLPIIVHIKPTFSLQKIPKIYNISHKYEELLQYYKSSKASKDFFEEKTHLEYKFDCRLNSLTAFEKLCQIFHTRTEEKNIIYLTGDNIKANYCKNDKMFIVISTSAINIFHLKICILHLMRENMDCYILGKSKDKSKLAADCKNAKTYQSKLELLSCTQIKNDAILNMQILQFENFFEIYNKLRKELQLLRIDI